MERQAQPLRVFENSLAQVEQDRLTEAARDHQERVRRDCAEQPESDVAEHCPRQRRPVSVDCRGHTVVDGVGDEQRPGDVRDVIDEDDRQREQRLLSMRANQ